MILPVYLVSANWPQRRSKTSIEHANSPQSLSPASSRIYIDISKHKVTKSRREQILRVCSILQGQDYDDSSSHVLLGIQYGLHCSFETRKGDRSNTRYVLRHLVKRDLSHKIRRWRSDTCRAAGQSFYYLTDNDLVLTHIQDRHDQKYI